MLQDSPEPPIKRLKQTVSFLPSDILKCAELLVTSNGDKWIFRCALCQKDCSDIGVLICHIKLEHLSNQSNATQLSSQLNDTESHVSPEINTTLQNNPNLTQPVANTIQLAHVSQPQELIKISCQQTTQSNINAEKEENSHTHISKVVDISSFIQSDSNVGENLHYNENIISTSQHFPTDINEEFFTIHQPQQLSSQTIGKQVIQIVQKNEDKETKKQLTSNQVEEEDNDEINSETNACSSPSEDDGDQNEDNNKTWDDNNDIDLETQGGNEAKKLPFECPYCKLKFKTRTGHTLHVVKRHDKNYGKRNRFRCKQCGTNFKTQSTYRTHLKYHDEVLECPICETKHYKHSLITHVLKHEGPTCFPCQVCCKIFADNDQRRAHWKTHSVELPFDCNICFRRFRYNCFLVAHMKGHKQYKCHFCPEHFKSGDVQRPPFVCPKCEILPDIKKQVEHQRTLVEKRRVFESDESSNDGEKNVDNTKRNSKSHDNNKNTLNEVTDEDDDNVVNEADDDSDLEFLNETNHDNEASGSAVQTQTNYSTGRFKCKLCDRDFSTRKGLKSHTINFHRSNYNENTIFAFKCSYCNRGFKSKSGYECHLRTHNKSKYQCRCPLCPYESLRHHDFITHILTHENDTCFPCQACGKLFSTKDERFTHWKSHAEEKPHYCNYCFRRFFEIYSLRRHLKTKCSKHIKP